MKLLYLALLVMLLSVACTKNKPIAGNQVLDERPVVKEELVTEGKPAATGEPAVIVEPDKEIDLAEYNRNRSPEVPVDPLSFDNLLGTWQFLNADGGQDSSGDYLRLETKDGVYSGLFVYQKHTDTVTLMFEDDNYYIISGRGEKYIVSRIRSSSPNTDNGIGLALITGFDDISLGFFQRDDKLKD